MIHARSTFLALALPLALATHAEAETYHVYYLPWESTGGYYPRITYPAFVSTADPAWERRVRAVYPASLPASSILLISF